MNIKKRITLSVIFLATAFVIVAKDEIKKGPEVVFISGQDLLTSKSGKEIQKNLQKKQEELTKHLKKDEDKVNEKKRKLQEDKKKFDKKAEEIAESKILNQEAKQEKFAALEEEARKLEEDKAELERLVVRLQSDYKRIEAKMTEEYQKEMNDFDKEVKQASEAVAKRNGHGIILMKESLVYGNDKFNITDEIKNELDKNFNKNNTKEVKELEKNLKD